MSEKIHFYPKEDDRYSAESLKEKQPLDKVVQKSVESPQAIVKNLEDIPEHNTILKELTESFQKNINTSTDIRTRKMLDKPNKFEKNIKIAVIAEIIRRQLAATWPNSDYSNLKKSISDSLTKKINKRTEEELLRYYREIQEKITHPETLQILFKISTDDLVDDSEDMMGGLERYERWEDSEHTKTTEQLKQVNQFLEQFSAAKKEPVVAVLNARSGTIYEHGILDWGDQITDPTLRQEFATLVRQDTAWKTNKKLAVFRVAKKWMAEGRLDFFYIMVKNFKFASYQTDKRINKSIPQEIIELAHAKANLVIIDASSKRYPSSFFDEYQGYEKKPKSSLHNEMRQLGYGDQEIKGLSLNELDWHNFDEHGDEYEEDIYDDNDEDEVNNDEGEKREKKETEYKKKKDIQDEFIKTTGPLRAKMMQHLKDGGGVLNHTTKVVLLNPSADLANRPWWDNLPQAMDPFMAERFAHRLDKKNPPPFLVMTNRGPMSFADFIRIKLRESSGKAALHAEARKKIQKDI